MTSKEARIAKRATCSKRYLTIRQNSGTNRSKNNGLIAVSFTTSINHQVTPEWLAAGSPCTSSVPHCATPGPGQYVTHYQSWRHTLARGFNCGGENVAVAANFAIAGHEEFETAITKGSKLKMGLSFMSIVCEVRVMRPLLSLLKDSIIHPCADGVRVVY